MEERPIISVRNAAITQENKRVMDSIHFDIHAGEFVYLIGQTGSGKSSILRTLYADLPLQKGEVKVAGFDLRSLKRKEVPFLRRQLGIIFQDFELFTDRSVEENLLFVLKSTGWRDKKLMLQRIEEVLGQVGLEEKIKDWPHQLSGGEQQRVAIARALLNRPQAILADEPTGNLDPAIAYNILQLFIEIGKEGTAVFMATHHHNFLRKFPSRVIYCEDQQIKDISRERLLQRLEKE